MVIIRDELHVDPAAAAHLAEQRALRVALLYEGWTPEEIQMAAGLDMQPRRVLLAPDIKAWLPTFGGLALDGLTIGLYAARKEQE